jgi:hypothetical protein
METRCNAAHRDFPRLGRRAIVADFDGGDITSDGGARLLRKAEQLTGVIRQCAACFTDHRDPEPGSRRGGPGRSAERSWCARAGRGMTEDEARTRSGGGWTIG